MNLEELRGFILSQRDSGFPIQIPHDLFQTTAALLRSLQQEVILMEDPFAEEAQFLIEKIVSIKDTAEELFQIRVDKIVSLAQSQASGSQIDREILRNLVPAELDMFNRIVDGIRSCRFALIEWRVVSSRPQQYKGPEAQEQEYSARSATPQIEPAHSTDPFSAERTEEPAREVCDDVYGGEEDRAYQTESDRIFSDDEDEDPFPYSLVRVWVDMEPFMGVDSRIYELRSGDIITIPKRNAEVLAERNIVLNINPG